MVSLRQLLHTLQLIRKFIFALCETDSIAEIPTSSILNVFGMPHNCSENHTHFSSISIRRIFNNRIREKHQHVEWSQSADAGRLFVDTSHAYKFSSVKFNLSQTKKVIQLVSERCRRSRYHADTTICIRYYYPY